MFEAISTCFNKADHLLYWIHVKDNISQKLESLCIETPNEYMCEIFGKTSGTTKVKELLDVTSEDQFELEWKRLEEIWKGRGSKGALFLSYMNVNKRNIMKKCMIAETRTRCGFVNPPDEYNQNANECMNSVLKRLKSFKKLTVKETIELIQNEVENQQEHMKLALIGKGQWRICQQFKSNLEISGEEYSKLASEKRKRYLSFRNTKQIRRYYHLYCTFNGI